MLPLLTAPWALAALAALPALAALYWLRNTWRETPVSSLMLWLHQSEAQATGLRMRRLQTPLLFYLEIAALALLAIAATGPRVETSHGRWPLVVVLDDSFSMLAGGDDSARRLAQAALERDIPWGDAYPVRFILAGEKPQTLGDTVWSWTEARQALEGWQCQAPAAQIGEAMVLAGELSGDKARILVLSDRPSPNDPEQGRLQWWSFGKARPNVAFVNAARSARDGQDRCLFEIANFAIKPQSTTLVLDTGAASQEIHRQVLALDAEEIRRVTLRLPKDLAFVRARIDDDALPTDNQMLLVREETPPVRVAVQLKNEALRLPFEKALAATGKIAPGGEQPQLLITEDPNVQPPAETWVVQLIAEKEGEAFVGPFVLDRTHPLTEGLNLAGVIWGAGTAREQPGAAIILAGNVPLITDAENFAGQHHLRIRLRPDLSTLLESPAWPIVVWNLIQWRAGELPGLRRANLRLGETAVVTTALGVETIVHTPPSGTTRVLPVQGQRVLVRPTEAGLHEMDASVSRHNLAVNPLKRDESDLSACVTGRWGEWIDDDVAAPSLQSLAWLPMLLALGVLTLHMYMATRARRK